MAKVPGVTNLDMKGGLPSELFGNLSQSNFYEVYITTDWVSGEGMKNFLANPDVQKSYNLDENFVTRNLGLLCSDAVLPASAFATSEVKDNFMGVNQEFAHTRLYTDIDLTFYVDNDYRSLGFFEAWMNYIAGGNSYNLAEPGAYDQNIDGNYYRRFTYPKFYMNSGGIYITKFEKNYNVPKATDITYQLVNAFPKAVNAVPVQYGNSEVMRVTITMYYDRYRLMRKSMVSTGATQEEIVAYAEDTGQSLEFAETILNGGFVETTL